MDLCDLRGLVGGFRGFKREWEGLGGKEEDLMRGVLDERNGLGFEQMGMDSVGLFIKNIRGD